MAEHVKPRSSFLGAVRERPLLGDGAMGTEIFARGVPFERCFEELNLSRPDLIRDIHRRYADAGADLLRTNSFGANAFRLAEHGLAAAVDELNRSAVQLARAAAFDAGREALVAGSVGPLGVRVAPLGRVQPAGARRAFAEQIAPLCAERVDLLLFETFGDLAELRQAIAAARDVSSTTPVIALMSFGEDGRTPLGDTPETVAAALLALGVDALGANCSVGPGRLVPVVERLAAAAPETPICVLPNAGWPRRVGARLFYPATPEYFATAAREFLDLGARLIGGCCGTTAAHIGAMRAVLDERRSADSTRSRAPHPPGEPTSGAHGTPAPTGLQHKLECREFVVAVEVDPPRGADPAKLLEAARELRRAGVDVIDVADTPMARLRMSAWALAHLIQREAEVETVLHFPTRGRNLLRLQGDLLAAHALGLRNLFIVLGDPPAVGDYPEAADPRDIVPSGLIRLITERFNAGIDRAGRPIGEPTAFFIGAALGVHAADPEREARVLRRKIESGARFVLTQPLFDPRALERFRALYRERFGELPIPVIAGVLPLASRRNAEFLRNEVPGLSVPDAALERMRGAPDGRREGVRMAIEAVEALRPHAQGVYVMPMLGRYDSAAEVVEAARRFAPRSSTARADRL